MIGFGINETLETDVEDVWRGTGTSPQQGLSLQCLSTEMSTYFYNSP